MTFADMSVPIGWTVESLGRAAGLRAKKPEPFEGRRPYLATADTDGVELRPSVAVSYSERPARADLILGEGEVLQAKMQNTEKAVYVTADQVGWLASTGFAQFNPTAAGANPRFIYHWLQSRLFQDQKNARCVGTTQRAISDRELRSIPIRLPPAREQERITRVLDAIDVVIRRTEELIAKLEQVKRGLLDDLLTLGVGPNGNLRDPVRNPELFVPSPLGPRPKTWRIKSLGSVGLISYGISDAIDLSLSRGIPTITLPCVSPNGDLDLRPEKLALTSPSKVAESLLLREGDLLFNWRNGSRHHLGKTALFPGGAAMTHVGFLLRIRIDRTEAVPQFAWHQLRHLKQSGLFLRAKSQVNNTFNSSELRNLMIAVPPLAEQYAIADVLGRAESRLKSERQCSSKLRSLRAGLMEDLLVGRVRVKDLLEGDAA